MLPSTLKQGIPVDDRSTDNAWVESTVVWLHCPKEDQQTDNSVCIILACD